MKAFVYFTAKGPLKCFWSVYLAGFLLTVIPQVRAQVFIKQPLPYSGSFSLYRYDIPTDTWTAIGPLPTRVTNDPLIGPFDAPLYATGPLYTDGMSIYTNGRVDARFYTGYRLLSYYPKTEWKIYTLAEKRPITGTGPVFTAAGANFYYFSSEVCPGIDSLQSDSLCRKNYLLSRNLPANTLTPLTVLPALAPTPGLIATPANLYGVTAAYTFALFDNGYFSTRATPPGPLTKKAVSIGDYVYVLGEADQVYRYTVSTDSWTTLSVTSPVVFDPALEVPGPPLRSITTDGVTLYATAGGYSFYSFDLSTNTWKRQANLPQLDTGNSSNLIYFNAPCSPAVCVPLVVSRVR